MFMLSVGSLAETACCRCSFPSPLFLQVLPLLALLLRKGLGNPLSDELPLKAGGIGKPLEGRVIGVTYAAVGAVLTAMPEHQGWGTLWGSLRHTSATRAHDRR